MIKAKAHSDTCPASVISKLCDLVKSLNLPVPHVSHLSSRADYVKYLSHRIVLRIK